MRLIVEHEDVLHAHQIGHDSLKHLALGLQSLQLFTTPALNRGASPFGDVSAFPHLEGVIVGNHDLGPLDVIDHVTGMSSRVM